MARGVSLRRAPRREKPNPVPGWGQLRTATGSRPAARMLGKAHVAHPRENPPPQAFIRIRDGSKGHRLGPGDSPAGTLLLEGVARPDARPPACTQHGFADEGQQPGWRGHTTGHRTSHPRKAVPAPVLLDNVAGRERRFLQGDFCPPGDTWRCLRTLLVVTNLEAGELVWASSGQRPGMLPEGLGPIR